MELFKRLFARNYRKGKWFQTYSGIQFYPVDPRIEEINIEDIAHGLAFQCRYNGHVREFFSVGQHSVLVSYHVPPHLALEGLMHDAAESYLGDVISPLKAFLGRYKKYEHNLEKLIALKYGLKFPHPPEIKHADLRVLMAEKRDLIPVQRKWSTTVEPIPERVVPLGPWAAKELFLDRFEELWCQRPEQIKKNIQEHRSERDPYALFMQ